MVNVTNESVKPFMARQQKSRKNGGGSSEEFRWLTFCLYTEIVKSVDIHMLKNTSVLLRRQNQYIITGCVNVELEQDTRLKYLKSNFYSKYSMNLSKII